MLWLSPKLNLDKVRATFPTADVQRVTLHGTCEQQAITVAFPSREAEAAARRLLAGRPDAGSETRKETK